MHKLECKNFLIAAGRRSIDPWSVDFVRDKDAVSGMLLFSLRWHIHMKKGNRLHWMIDMYHDFWFYTRMRWYNLVRQGAECDQQIKT